MNIITPEEMKLELLTKCIDEHLERTRGLNLKQFLFFKGKRTIANPDSDFNAFMGFYHYNIYITYDSIITDTDKEELKSLFDFRVRKYKLKKYLKNN
jgi:hypothetical protein